MPELGARGERAGATRRRVARSAARRPLRSTGEERALPDAALGNRISSLHRLSALPPIRKADARGLRVSPEQGYDVPDAGHEVGLRSSTKVINELFALCRLEGRKANLDELMRTERGIELAFYRLRQPLVADAQHWLQVVCQGTQASHLG